MARPLAEQLLASDRRAALVRDAARLVESEVAKKSGLSGFALQTAFSVIRGAGPAWLPNVLDRWAPELVAALEGPYSRARAAGEPLGVRFGQEKAQIAEALLGIVDTKASRSTNATAVKAYQKLRGSAVRHLEEAVPGLAALLERHSDPSNAP
jgi:hypothetical protein